jgi:hypothetical protein
MAELAGEDHHDAESIMVELSEDGETGRLFIVTNLDRRLVVAANRSLLSELRRQLSGLFGH